MRTRQKKRASFSPNYAERINLAIDHIFDRLAGGDSPRLTDVARAAGLSPFHFHRVFQMMVGSTVADFVRDRRLHRALFLMAYSPRASLTSIALDAGFSSSSDFSRCFRTRFGLAPSRFDLCAWRAANREQLESIVQQAAPDWGVPDSFKVRTLPARRNPDGFKVRIRELAPRSVAYIRVRDPYKDNAVQSAADRLVQWADNNTLSQRGWLGYQYENPEITPLERCCYHVAVEADGFTPKGEVGRFRFPAMLVAQVEIRGSIELELRALQWLYGVWLPRSGYVPDDHPCFEAWIGKPFAHGTAHFELFAQLPIKRGI